MGKPLSSLREKMQVDTQWKMLLDAIWPWPNIIQSFFPTRSSIRFVYGQMHPFSSSHLLAEDPASLASKYMKVWQTLFTYPGVPATTRWLEPLIAGQTWLAEFYCQAWKQSNSRSNWAQFDTHKRPLFVSSFASIALSLAVCNITWSIQTTDTLQSCYPFCLCASSVHLRGGRRMQKLAFSTILPAPLLKQGSIYV